MKGKIFGWKIKLFLIIFLTSMLPILTISFVFLNRSKNAIIDQISTSLISSTNFAIDNIDYSLKAIDEISKSILTDDRVINTASITRKFSNEEKVEKYNELRELLNYTVLRIQNKYRLSGLYSYYIYIPNQNTVIDSETTYYENVITTKLDFIDEALNSNISDKWFITNKIGFDSTNIYLKSDGLLTLRKTLVDANNKTIAIIAINVSEYFLNDYFSKSKTGLASDPIVLDTEARIVSYSDKSVIGDITETNNSINEMIVLFKNNQGQFTYQDNLIVYSISNYTKWRYINIIPLKVAMDSINSLQGFLIIVVSLTFIIVLGITYILSNISYKPLNKLVYALHQVEKRNLNIQIHDKRNDEYKQVFSVFNKMVNELNLLISDLTTEKLLNKEAEIKLLQAQINPHFLYNTLESINSLAKMKKIDEISTIVTALSKFFRISLSSGKAIVPLSEAVELAIVYLTVQNIRFMGKIEYQVQIANCVKTCQVPKFIIQPIVENSIIHGFENSEKIGTILIYCSERNSVLTIRIEDNGCGIISEKLILLQNSLIHSSFDESEHFALKNINKQIKLKYGEEYGIKIESEFGKGTTVEINLPVQHGGID